MSKAVSLHTAITKISTEYKKSKTEAFKKHPLADYIRHEFTQAIDVVAKQFSTRFISKSSPGNGNWATVPWGAVFDPSITSSATKGFYVVYLFSDYSETIHLSLNQGTTSLLNEFKSQGYDILADRVKILRARLSDYHDKLPISHIDFKDKNRLTRGYAEGHVLGIDYYLTSLPDSTKLVNDLRLILEAYTALDFRGGSEESSSQIDDDDIELSKRIIGIEETRKYKMHRKLDRRAGVAQKVKEQLGTTCEACEMNFYETYGSIGENFIEAHHKIPISSLEEGSIRQYDILKDFAVLCSNCHRMIHRLDDPSDIQKLKKIISDRRK